MTGRAWSWARLWRRRSARINRSGRACGASRGFFFEEVEQADFLGRKPLAAARTLHAVERIAGIACAASISFGWT